MDFAVSVKQRLRKCSPDYVKHIAGKQRNICNKRIGSIEQWKKHYMEVYLLKKCRKDMQR